MSLTQLDRMSAVMLAKTIASNRSILDLKDELYPYVRRLYRMKIFSQGEIAEFAQLSKYRMNRALAGEEEFIAKTGVATRHLDHLIRMIGTPEFAKLHIKSLIEDGATYAAIYRITDIPESTLRRWVREES